MHMLPRCPITMQNVLLPKRPITEMSYYRNVQLPKCPVTEMSVTKTSITKVSVTEMSGYHIIYSMHKYTAKLSLLLLIIFEASVYDEGGFVWGGFVRKELMSWWSYLWRAFLSEGVLSEGVLSGRSLCTDEVMYGGSFVRGGFVLHREVDFFFRGMLTFCHIIIRGGPYKENVLRKCLNVYTVTAIILNTVNGQFPTGQFPTRTIHHWTITHSDNWRKTTKRCTSAIPRATAEFPTKSALCRLSEFLWAHM